MDFILNNSGLLFGIGLVAVFAIIGYFADKKDNSNKNVNAYDKPLKSDNVPSELDDSSVSSNDIGEYNKIVSELDKSKSSEQFKFDNDLFDTNDSTDLNNNPGISDYNTVNSDSSNVETDNISNETDILNNNDFQASSVSNNNYSNNLQAETHIDSFSANDFESLDISLEDLERKNFSDVLNKKNVNDDENFYYSNIDNSYSDDLDSSDSTISSVNDFGADDNQDNVSTEAENQSNSSIDVEEQGDVSSGYDHLFDGETQSFIETTDDSSIDSKSDAVESVDIVDNSSDSKIDSSDSIPELFGDSSNYNDINNNGNESSDDEIWKF